MPKPRRIARIIHLRTRSLLKTLYYYVADSHLRSAYHQIRGTTPGCGYTIPVWRRFPVWLVIASGAAFIAPRVSDFPLFHQFHDGPMDCSFWNGLVVSMFVAFIHTVLERWVFGGQHLHCGGCDACAYTATGRAFEDRRNAIAFVISELGWDVTGKGRRVRCLADHSTAWTDTETA